MYKVAICDDDLDTVNEISSLINEYFEYEYLECSLSLFYDAKSIMTEIAAGKESDIYILDIIMPEVDGMELAEFIRKYDKNCSIIFITFSKDYAISGYKVDALDYIVKPINKEELYAALKRSITHITKTGTLVIKIKNTTGYKELDVNDIMYAQSSGHIVYFGMADGSISEVVASLEQYAPLLTKYKMFLRCHKSYIINLSFVKEKKNDCFILKNNKMINISRKNKAVCKSRYHKYIFAKMKAGL